MEKAIFAGGCFWCTEAVFQRIKGVEKVESGFCGGRIKNPAYREVVSGHTNHAEAVRVTYDPDVVDYTDLLTVFFGTHDPTTLNRQAYDVGTQYRSAVFHLNDEQKKQAENFIKLLEDEDIFDDPIVTEVTKAGIFYKAENEHQDYYNQHRSQGYCTAIIDPKVQKLRDYHQDLLKEEAKAED